MMICLILDCADENLSELEYSESDSECNNDGQAAPVVRGWNVSTGDNDLV
jgi:hypothetical protein